jgi:hypothetical protein
LETLDIVFSFISGTIPELFLLSEGSIFLSLIFLGLFDFIIALLVVSFKLFLFLLIILFSFCSLLFLSV